MKCCSEEDILYTTRHNELYVRKYVGMEGYFANSTKELMRKIQDDSFISKIKDTVIATPSDFDWCPLYYTEVISDVDNSPYCIFFSLKIKYLNLISLWHQQHLKNVLNL
uniref:hypothetical protein n=1 Tax=Succinivibrio sp. TaxID=2053619 RepID=UPI003FEFE4C8